MLNPYVKGAKKNGVFFTSVNRYKKNKKTISKYDFSCPCFEKPKNGQKWVKNGQK